MVNRPREGTCRTEMAQGEDEQSKTDSVAQEADDARREESDGRGKAGAAGKSDEQVDGACDQPLQHGDLDRIGG